jgi:hypothetical protein
MIRIVIVRPINTLMISLFDSNKFLDMNFPHFLLFSEARGGGVKKGVEKQAEKACLRLIGGVVKFIPREVRGVSI